LQDCLTDCGQETILARDGNEAWQIITQSDVPHICILDWTMPQAAANGTRNVQRICRDLGL